MKDKIYFIYCQKPYLINPNIQVGLGLLSLATYANSLGCDVEIINGQSKAIDWIPLIQKGSTVCLGGCSVDVPVINHIGKKFREMGCHVIIGGPISNCPFDIDPLAVDCVVSGPGEPIVYNLANGKKPTGFVEVNHDLDYEKYPYPDRSLLGEHIGGNIFHSKSGEIADESTTILTSRGCKFRCSFCTSGGNKNVFGYSMDRIKDEINDIDFLGINNIRISDDNILCDMKRFEKLCRALSKYNMKWRASVRTVPSSSKMYRFMKSCGCVELSFGIESADNKVLKILHKGTTTQDNTIAVENAVKAGINVRALMMMGTPGETQETLKLNIDWIQSHPEITVCMCMFYPFPGTDIFNRPKKYGCTIEKLGNPNIYMFRSDGSLPEAHISIDGGLSREVLTHQYAEMERFLTISNQGNRG